MSVKVGNSDLMKKLAEPFADAVVKTKPGRGGSRPRLPRTPEHCANISASVKRTKSHQSEATAEFRFIRNIVEVPSSLDTPCWEWQGKRNHAGYGVFKTYGKNTLIHVFAYKHWIGPIPDGLRLDHLCRNRACGNPAHVEPKTDRANILCGEGVAAINARKTHCAHGHEFNEANTLISGGRRNCRVCLAIRAQRKRVAA